MDREPPVAEPSRAGSRNWELLYSRLTLHHFARQVNNLDSREFLHNFIAIQILSSKILKIQLRKIGDIGTLVINH